MPASTLSNRRDVACNVSAGGVSCGGARDGTKARETLQAPSLRGRLTSDELKIVKLFEDGDRALIAADAAGLVRIFADDYMQYDESGRASTKQDVIEKLTSGKIRYVSMASTGRQIRFLTDNIAVVHGSEDDVVEQAGKRFPVSYVYMDVVMKREGRWRIVASQLAMPVTTGD
jgi:uncharacterized protein (TIGR02246 family)